MSRTERALRPMPVRPASRPVYSAPVRATIGAFAALLLSASAGCEETGTSSTGSGGEGGGGEGGGSSGTGAGGCLVTPQPTFSLRVLDTEGGPVPPDTTIEVMWSAGAEPVFHLDEPATWATLETSNVVCDVDPSMPPPTDLLVLSCALWTSSPTEVRVSADGFVTKEHTYTAEPGTDCNPEPTPIEIELSADHE